MWRTNQFTAHPSEHWVKRCVFEWLAACCAFWNEVNYKRRQTFFETGDWTAAETSHLYDEYAPVTGAATAHSLIRKNAEAWRSFDSLNHMEDEHPSPPGYWGNREDGYDLRSVLRNDCYEIDFDADGSSLTFVIGKALKEKFSIEGRCQRITLELRGNSRWQGKQGRLDLAYDEDAACFRVNQPVRVQPASVDALRRQEFSTTPDSGNTDDENVAAIDIGANNLLTIVTDQGDVLIYSTREQFERFADDIEHLGSLRSRLPTGIYSSRRIRRGYRRTFARRDHMQAAAVKHAARWLRQRGITDVIIGDLTGKFPIHRASEVNLKKFSFWAYRKLSDRIKWTFELADIEVVLVDEAASSSVCPLCENTDITRSGDTVICAGCSLDTHADIVGAANILQTHGEISISDWFRPMARPTPRDPVRERDGHQHSVTYLQWDDYEWRPISTFEVATLGSIDQRDVSKPARTSTDSTGCEIVGGRPHQ